MQAALVERSPRLQPARRTVPHRGGPAQRAGSQGTDADSVLAAHAVALMAAVESDVQLWHTQRRAVTPVSVPQYIERLHAALRAEAGGPDQPVRAALLRRLHA